jgi:hypothetical protein
MRLKIDRRPVGGTGDSGCVFMEVLIDVENTMSKSALGVLAVFAEYVKIYEVTGIAVDAKSNGIS